MKNLIIGLLFIISLIFPASVEAVDGKSMIDPLIRSQFDHLPTQEMKHFWDRFHQEYQQFFSAGLPQDIFTFLQSMNSKEFSLAEFGKGLLRYFLHEVLYNGKLLGMIIVLTVLSMILQTLQTAFEQNQVSRVAYAVVFMVILILAIQSFSSAVTAAKAAIGQMVDFMVASVPLLLTLLASMGNLASVALFHPFIIFMIHIVSLLIYLVILPFFFFSTILSIVSTISDKYRVDQLARLMNKFSITLLGGSLTIFLGVLSIQGATAAVTDGIAIRTAKYVTGNFIPVIGRTISDAADTVLGASLLVKNTLGLAGVIILLMICAFPALKILSLALIYHFSAAVLQPLGNSPIIESLGIIGRTLVYVFAALAAVGLMFFLAITIMVSAGNIAVMMR
ncbi:stage III sporulation protein AE [Seinonella peptonophila]|uniref:Stage III sporulation protein AE n=1 Tax=Seinonella peptonophila TaxID=112248 RepID=A0A1M4TN96_9BACL|nr:stage III sporulation protein AE [Seinonella peptonophila]